MENVPAEARADLKDYFAASPNLRANEALASELSRRIDARRTELANQLMLIYVSELQSFNDAEMPSLNQIHPRKLFAIGHAHLVGEDVQQDSKKAEQLLRKSAELGHSDARVALAQMHYKGSAEFQEAAKCFSAAAESGDAYAQNILGSVYEAGEGVEKDRQQAINFYLTSASQGFSAALTNLGVLFSQGGEVAPDHILARMWFQLGADLGDDVARENLETIDKLLTPTQIREFDELVSERKRYVLGAMGDGAKHMFSMIF